MQTNNKKSIENKSNKNELKSLIDELLLNNKEIFNQLLITDRFKKEIFYDSIDEYELIKDFENNLIALINRCSFTKLNEVLKDVSNGL